LADKNIASEELVRIRRRLADLNEERMELERELEAFEQQLNSDSRAEAEKPVFADAPVTNNSPSIEKVELFRRLFAGPSGRLPGSMGKQKGWTLRLFAGLFQRVGERDLW
jgi:hypothetical protein